MLYGGNSLSIDHQSSSKIRSQKCLAYSWTNGGNFFSALKVFVVHIVMLFHTTRKTTHSLLKKIGDELLDMPNKFRLKVWEKQLTLWNHNKTMSWKHHILSVVLQIKICQTIHWLPTSTEGSVGLCCNMLQGYPIDRWWQRWDGNRWQATLCYQQTQWKQYLHACHTLHLSQYIYTRAWHLKDILFPFFLSIGLMLLSSCWRRVLCAQSL